MPGGWKTVPLAPLALWWAGRDLSFTASWTGAAGQGWGLSPLGRLLGKIMGLFSSFRQTKMALQAIEFLPRGLK